MPTGQITRDYNPGIGLLRAVACWLVIVCHFPDTSHEVAPWHYPLLMIRQLAVPVFMTLTFYFGGAKLLKSDPQWLKKRLERICVPIIVWSVVSYVVLKNTIFPGLTLDMLAGQIITGSIPKINGPMWFMNALLVVTLILFVVSLLPKKSRIGVFWAVFVLSVVVQYIPAVLIWVKENNNSWSVQQLALQCFLMMPYALAGIFCSRYNLFDRIDRMPWYYGAVCAVILFGTYYIINPYDIDSYGIRYVGASLWIGCAAMIMLFLSLSKAFKSDKAKRRVKTLTSYTLGIYCMHLLVGRMIRELLWRNGVPITGFELTFIIYPVCYLLCWGISKIPSRWVRMLVD